MKTYCLPTLLFGFEIWNLSDRSICVSSTWRGIIVFDIYFEVSVGKVLSHCSFCGSLPLSYLLDQRRVLFWNRMMRSDNIVLRTLSHFIRNRAMAVGSVYNVDVLSMSHTGVKNAVWYSFTSLVHSVLGL